jgi:hypothetical protein
MSIPQTTKGQPRIGESLLRGGRLLFAVSSLVIIVTAPTKSTFAENRDRLDALLAESHKDQHYAIPSRMELERGESLFLQTLRGEGDYASLKQAWATLHFELIDVRLEDQQIWFLRELPHHKRGRGCYAFRRNASLPIVLQAPHSFFDTHTGTIASRLFQESNVAAAAWNTVHRSKVDFAHERTQWFNSFTRAVTRYHDRSVIVQLHGFAKAKRTTQAAASADIIISNGTKHPSLWLRRATHVFAQRFESSTVCAYPWDVSELGGTTNVQGQIMRAAGRCEFLHLELSKKTRQELNRRSSARKRFLTSLAKSYLAMNPSRERQ